MKCDLLVLSEWPAHLLSLLLTWLGLMRLLPNWPFQSTKPTSKTLSSFGRASPNHCRWKITKGNFDHFFNLSGTPGLICNNWYVLLHNFLQALTDQLSCGSCGKFAALAPHPDPHATSLSPGILCSACAGRRRSGDRSADSESEGMRTFWRNVFASLGNSEGAF